MAFHKIKFPLASEIELHPSLVLMPIGLGFTERTVIELSALNFIRALFPNSKLEASPCEKEANERNRKPKNSLNFMMNKSKSEIIIILQVRNSS